MISVRFGLLQHVGEFWAGGYKALPVKVLAKHNASVSLRATELLQQMPDKNRAAVAVSHPHDALLTDLFVVSGRHERAIRHVRYVKNKAQSEIKRSDKPQAPHYLKKLGEDVLEAQRLVLNPTLSRRGLTSRLKWFEFVCRLHAARANAMTGPTVL